MLWGGRFERNPTEEMMSFSSSISFDSTLYREDIFVNRIWAKALCGAKVLNEEELGKLTQALNTIENEFEKGVFVFDKNDEDIHSAIERRLTELCGNIGKKIHTGRSRNDQVVTDLRLFVIKAARSLRESLARTIEVLVNRSEELIDIYMPGYTHLQHAQPVLLSHHLMAHAETLKRDHERFGEVTRRASVCPLGSAALAGTVYDIDRDMIARELGFLEASKNSMDAVSDRDFVVETVFCCSMGMIHLSRLAEELVLWSTSEFNFVKLPEEFTTGSSIMPQKRNPDSCELIRAKTGRVAGDLVSLIVALKALPLAYNRDLQEDKEPLFDALETFHASLSLMRKIMEGCHFMSDELKEAVNSGFLTATDLADYLTNKGVPFRDAHWKAGMIVKKAEELELELSKMPLEEMRKIAPEIEDDVYIAIDIKNSLFERRTAGGTSPLKVRESIGDSRNWLASIRF